MTRFLIDENLTPVLVRTAQEHGFQAFHVAHRGWSACSDPVLLGRILDESLTLVTNNWDDFRPMFTREELHPGAVVIMPSVRRDRQVELFTAVLRAVTGSDPPLDLVNTVLTVDADGRVTMHSLSQGC